MFSFKYLCNFTNVLIPKCLFDTPELFSGMLMHIYTYV